MDRTGFDNITKREKDHYLRRSKHEVAARLDQFKETKATYPTDDFHYIQAWAELKLSAKIYTAVKRTIFLFKSDKNIK